MGLPLFVAPVESDLPPKTAVKSESTSPSRSSIRRGAPNSRERRARREQRLQNAVERLNSTMEGRDPSTELPPSVRRAVEARMARQRAMTGDRASEGSSWPPILGRFDPMHRDLSDIESRPLREALREMSQSDDQRRARMEEQIHALFGDAAMFEPRRMSRRESDRQALDTDLDLAAMGTQPSTRRARIARDAPVVHRFDRSPEGEEGSPSSQLLPAINNGRLPGRISSSSATGVRRRSLGQDISNMTGTRRSLLSVQGRGVDGLGDRNRSVSPEVWDTLLTTLTPDPQPPSASSSFVSAAASHSAGASSNTTPPASNPPEESMVDAACENSDPDEPILEDSMYERLRRRRDESARARGALLGGPAMSAAGLAARLGARAGREERENHSVQEQAAQPDITSVDGMELEWSGDFAGVRPVEPRRRNREGSAPSASHTTSAGEEDWSGMQRIVRSMALREDIPDEWWAEAGLSRTLSRDDAN